MDREGLVRRHEELVQIRSCEEKSWRDIARMIRPDDIDFDPQSQRSQRDDAEIFDSTPLYANEDFAAGIFGQATNPVNRWCEVSIPDKELAKWGPAAGWLYTVGSVIHASLSPSVSAFYAQAPAWFADVGAFGFGTLSSEERVGKGRIIDRARPIGSMYIDVDEDGEVDTYHNAFRWKGRRAKHFFGDLGARLPVAVRDDQDYLWCHAAYPNPDYDPRRLGVAFKPFRSCYFSPDVRDFFLEGGNDDLPYHALMWNTRAGKVYPRGPGHNARADMNSLNEMERSHLVAGQFAAEPVLLAREESMLSAADVVPNAFLYGGMSERGEPLVGILERKQQLQLSMAQSEQKRQAIRDAFFFGLMQLVNRPQMTLGEFNGWQTEKLRSMAPNLSRIQIGLSSFIKHRFRMLAKAGRIPEPPQELVGQALDVDYVSPLAKLQKMDEGRAVLTLHEGVEKMAVTDPSVRDNFDGDIGVRVLAGSLYAVPGLLRDEREVEAIRAARAKAQQQAAELEQAGQAVEIAATASHAVQASTLANTRGGRAA